jgi:LysM repeat protein
MNNFRQVFLGFGAALLSIFLVLGSFSIAFTEGGMMKTALQLTEPVNLFPTQVLPLTSVPIPGVTATTAPILAEETNIVISETPPPEVAACEFPPGWYKITVQFGDTINSLAVAYGTSTEVLVQGNCLVINNLIAGMVLFVPAAPTTTPEEICGPPPGWVYYTVQFGDTLYGISQMVGSTIYNLQLANCMVGQSDLRVGQQLYVPFVPASAKTSTPTLVYSATPVSSQTPSFATPTTMVIATRTPTVSIPPSQTPTATVTQAPADTTTPTATITLTSTPTDLPTATPTDTPLPTETPTPLPTLTPTGGLVAP